jgi:DNA-binding MarR family transcriptional regulator
MHTIFFASKRVHLEVVWRLTRPLLEESECGLTPARFDLMRIVNMREHGVLQGTLQWLLGVSAPTISRMVKALVELGMVRRTYYELDTRCRKVHITEKGVEAVAKALAATVGVREDERAVARCALGDTTQRKRGSADETERMIARAKTKVRVLANALARMRKALFDVAAAPHPWRATDTMIPPDLQEWFGPTSRYAEDWPAWAS